MTWGSVLCSSVASDSAVVGCVLCGTLGNRVAVDLGQSGGCWLSNLRV